MLDDGSDDRFGVVADFHCVPSFCVFVFNIVFN